MSAMMVFPIISYYAPRAQLEDSTIICEDPDSPVNPYMPHEQSPDDAPSLPITLDDATDLLVPTSDDDGPSVSIIDIATISDGPSTD